MVDFGSPFTTTPGIATTGAGTWAIKARIAVSVASGTPIGAYVMLLIGGANYQLFSSTVQPSINYAFVDIAIDVADLTYGETIDLQYRNLNPFGSPPTMTFAADSAQQGDAGQNFFTATWLHP